MRRSTGRTVVEAYDTAAAAGHGVLTVGGSMSTLPVVERARRISRRRRSEIASERDAEGRTPSCRVPGTDDDWTV